MANLNTYLRCKKIITDKTYFSKDEMLDMLDVFLLGKRITQEEYTELINLLNS